jgi:hypothetical protein
MAVEDFERSKCIAFRSCDVDATDSGGVPPLLGRPVSCAAADASIADNSTAVRIGFFIGMTCSFSLVDR